MEILVLGPVEVRRNGEILPLGGSKQRSILALLVANLGHPMPVERIVDGVYGEDAAEGARHSVQTFISLIRRELGAELIPRSNFGYTLAVDPGSIDAVRFEEQVRTAMEVLDEDPEMAGDSLRGALAMWRGHAYADVDGRAVFEPEIARLTEVRMSALEARIDADLAAGGHREMVGELEALTAEYPLRERFRAQQMLALYRAGRQTEALRVYERTRVYLAEEIGIPPSSDLRRLEQQILEQRPELDLPVAPSVIERAVMVVDVAEVRSLTRLEPAQRSSLVDAVAGPTAAAVERQGGEGFAQRGSAFYAAFPTVGAAVATVDEIIVAQCSAENAGPRIAVDFGDVEVHESGEVAGPPVRRSAGMVAAAHPGQVLLSAEAHHALMADQEVGWQAKALGPHSIYGIEAPFQVFQLVLEGRQSRFPPLRIDATPPPLPMDRRAVAGYELRRPLSSDLTGTTYRAYQSSVGREVTVTAVDPVWANEPEFVRRFEVEAQLVGRLQHAHIVPLLDYWRDPTGAYLVTPAVEGSTLAELLGRGALDGDGRRRALMQVGAALSYAHRAGVIHGAVSPDTVTVDASGNAYLSGVGFVMSLVGAPRAASSFAGSELPRGGSVGIVEDVTGLGVLAERLLGTGTETPESGLAELVDRATADAIENRMSSVDEFLEELDGVLGNREFGVPFTPARNPYKGLQAFSEADAVDFFGRTDAVAVLAEMVAQRALVAVVGPSGSGKSSLVKAGLIPEIRSGAIDGSAGWAVTDMYPGSYPFSELESALARVAVTDAGGVLDELDRDPESTARSIKRLLPAETQLLLVIDQFEELFTLTRDDDTRVRFLEALVALAADGRSRTKVVVTLRADFFDRPLQHPAFWDLIEAGLFGLTAPTREQLAAAVRQPAETVGVGWEPGLVDQIVSDVADEPGTLPLLQYVLTELFATRESDRLTHEEYQLTGGVLGALGMRADEVYEQLSPHLQDLTRQLLLRLVTVGPSEEATRRRARLVELNAVADPAEVRTVLDAFGEARLLTFDRDPTTRSPTVEVAHEALLARWDRLADWITEAREDLLLHRRLANAVDEWDEQGRDESYLLSGGRLAQFQSWAASTELILTRDEPTTSNAAASAPNSSGLAAAGLALWSPPASLRLQSSDWSSPPPPSSAGRTPRPTQSWRMLASSRLRRSTFLTRTPS